MTYREELLNSPKRKWDEELKDVKIAYVFPSRRKHDSGFRCMDCVALSKGKRTRFGGGCDDIALEGSHFRIDCDSAGLRIWNRKGFSVSHDLSSICFTEEVE